MNHIAILAVSAAFLVGPFRSAAGQKEQVLETAQQLFDAMAKRDTVVLRGLLHPTAQFFSTLETADSVIVRTVTRDQILAQVVNAPAPLLERMWNAEVRISGVLATIWTSYDFHSGGQWSHCGIDAFQLVKGTRGWQVLSIAYTVVRAAERCKSPLGPPG